MEAIPAVLGQVGQFNTGLQWKDKQQFALTQPRLRTIYSSQFAS